MKTLQRKQILTAIRIGLVANIALALLKLIFGYLGNAQALFSDGLNSASDVLISVMMLLALRISTKKPDYDHPYGHEKFEGLAYFLLGIIFTVTAGWIFISGIVSIIEFFINGETIVVPLRYTVLIAFISLVIKLGIVFLYTKAGRKTNSPTIKADVKNHLLDVYATLSSLIGLSIAQFGLIYFDYIASIVIAGFILKLAIQILKESISYLTDQAPEQEDVQKVYDEIFKVDGVLSIDDLKVRNHMTQQYVDVEIGVLSSLTLKEAHHIAEKVHHHVENLFPEVIHCMVHVNPHKKSQS
ncbi:MAG: cation diffusion facilitator family transporter [Acholeplasmataceae bacterium]|nr:cation transporter [Acholeplasmataceae bacterium]